MYIAIFLLKHLQLILVTTFPIYYINTIVSEIKYYIIQRYS